MGNYRTIAKIVKGGKRIGFLFETTDKSGRKVKKKLTDKQIKNMMCNGEIFDLTLDNKGFKFKDKSRTIKSLKVVSNNLNTSKKSSTEEHKIILEEYTGDTLREFVMAQKMKSFKKRDFVAGILEYCKGDLDRVLSISGLRGTGKTTGLQQAIIELDDYDNTVFINIDELAYMDCLDLRNIIVKKYFNKKYFFIDEVTRVNDLINNSGFLADSLCKLGKKVIVSGTDSLSLVKSEGAGLYHRAININVTHITYKEAKRTMNQSLKKYMQIGGLYEADAIKDISELRRYVDTAVIDNIMNTLTKNKGATSLLGLDGIKDKSKLRTMVFRIIYAIIYCNMQKIRPTNVSALINLFDISNSSIHTASSINSLVCSEMKVDSMVDTDTKEIQSLLDAMEDIGILVKAYNITNKREINYYVTNPSIVNQVLGSIVSFIETKVPDKIPNATVKGIMGQIFESIVVTHTKKICDKNGYKLYYYHDNKNREIDLIVLYETSDEFDDLYLYYEIKLTNDVDTAVVKSRWLNDPNIRTQDGVVIERNIIYTGQDCIFKGFTDKSTYPPKGLSLKQIESQNMGVKLINAEDYLLNTSNMLSILKRVN